MAWQDNIQSAAYTSPSGARFEFQWEDVSVDVDKKTTLFTFPEKDGAFIQDLGTGGRNFPFTIFFSGSDYDEISDAFFLALEEKGAGKLEHPKYGDRIVVPTGKITRRDNITTAGNQAVFQVAFSETIEEITFPLSSESTKDEIDSIAGIFQENTAVQVAEAITLDNANEAASLQVTANESVNKIALFLEDLAKLTDDIKAAFDTVKVAYQENVKNVITNASSVLEQAILLIRLPSQVGTSITDQFDSYGSMIDNLISSVGTSDGSNVPSNNYLYANTLVSAALSALCEGSIKSTIASRPEAVLASEEIIDYYDKITTWQDENITALGLIDSGQSFSALTSVISKTAIYLVNASFDLPSEHRETIQDDRNVIEYLASVGLDVETDLDFFIQINELTACEIEIMPKGLEVVYYV